MTPKTSYLFKYARCSNCHAETLAKDLDRIYRIDRMMVKKMIKNNLSNPVLSCLSCQESQRWSKEKGKLPNLFNRRDRGENAEFAEETKEVNKLRVLCACSALSVVNS